MLPDKLFNTEPQFVEGVDEPVGRSEVLRYLGYPEGVSPNDRIGEEIDRWIEEGSQLAKPQATYVVLPVADKGPRWLRVETPTGTTEFKGAIGEFLGSSLGVAVFIATAGPHVENRASDLLREHDGLAAMVLNAVGAERAEAAESVVINQLRQQAHKASIAPTLPYSPGYCGMPLTEQKKLFALFDNQAIGVTLTDSCLMQPIKSVSGLIGLVLTQDLEIFRSPCDRCELHNCNMRR
jgi:hypothetical protein